MNKITYLVVILIIIIGFFYFQNNLKTIDIENISVPINYTLDSYNVAETSNISCKKSIECITPEKYLMMSSCPYTSLCINNKCSVVCPEYKTPTIVGGDRDIHGCIGSAGYSWCQVKNKCLRVWEEKCEVSTSTSKTTTGSSTISESFCNKKEGIWYPTENICEVNQLLASQCKTQGGVFNECASACRHDPKAQVCNMMCALTCTFR